MGDDPGKLLAQLHIEIEKGAPAHRHIPVKLPLIIKGGQCGAKLLAPPSPDRVGTTVKITKGCRKSLLLGVTYGTTIHPHRPQGAGRERLKPPHVQIEFLKRKCGLSKC